MITSDTHTMVAIASAGGVTMFELVADAGPQTRFRFYVVREREQNGQVMSACRPDFPTEGGTWVAARTPGGIAYVATGRTRATARRWFRELTGQFCADE